VPEPVSEAPIVELAGVRAPLGERRGRSLALEVDELRVGRGERVAVVGPSGCGKSSLLRLVAGLLRADAGTVRVLGRDLRAMSPRALDRFRGERIGLVEQGFHLLDDFTARENLLLGMRFGRAIAAREQPARAAELLRRVGLEALAGERPPDLSYGERQRVAIVRALASRPAIILADEPTAALDAAAADDVVTLIGELAHEARCALLFVTHDDRIARCFPRRFDASSLVTLAAETAS